MKKNILVILFIVLSSGLTFLYANCKATSLTYTPTDAPIEQTNTQTQQTADYKKVFFQYIATSLSSECTYGKLSETPVVGSGGAIQMSADGLLSSQFGMLDLNDALFTQFTLVNYGDTDEDVAGFSFGAEKYELIGGDGKRLYVVGVSSTRSYKDNQFLSSTSVSNSDEEGGLAHICSRIQKHSSVGQKLKPIADKFISTKDQKMNCVDSVNFETYEYNISFNKDGFRVGPYTVSPEQISYEQIHTDGLGTVFTYVANQNPKFTFEINAAKLLTKVIVNRQDGSILGCDKP